MRKAGRVGLWWALVVVSWLPLSALAQDGPPEMPTSRIASDPRLAAASKAWHDAWRVNIEAHLRTVATRGTPRDLLVAGWLWPIEEDVDRVQAAGSLFRAQARAWMQAAYDGARGDDALVDWALLGGCPRTGATCDRTALLQRLMAADPGNAEILLAAYQDAVERKDTAMAERYWQAAAAGTHYRSRINELGALMASVLRQVPATAPDPALASAMGEAFGLDRDATSNDVADVSVMAMNAATAMPTLQPIRQRCTAQVGRLPADAVSACRRIYALVAADTTTLIGPLVALPRVVEWAETPADRDAARERLRSFAWVYENSFLLYQRPAAERRMPVDYIDRFFRDGELAAMRYQLRLNGIATEAPAGWLPDNPEYRALLTGASVPVAR